MNDPASGREAVCIQQLTMAAIPLPLQGISSVSSLRSDHSLQDFLEHGLFCMSHEILGHVMDREENTLKGRVAIKLFRISSTLSFIKPSKSDACKVVMELSASFKISRPDGRKDRTATQRLLNQAARAENLFLKQCVELACVTIYAEKSCLTCAIVIRQSDGKKADEEAQVHVSARLTGIWELHKKVNDHSRISSVEGALLAL
ncbi:uncharacterized protein LOC118243996 [Cygnus atratus]|uniref:uncharacterized protein LOC118243996 n=1 Tax=Cygnus atratus TaxID=8868 RepID=UPI0015D5A9D3|nr:uncharacterized protein LOC118243996 [Cygnus atratus]XP_035394554.1 uncharacterized protein LOC118243996 [Cygnus atratus]